MRNIDGRGAGSGGVICWLLRCCGCFLDAYAAPALSVGWSAEKALAV